MDRMLELIKKLDEASKAYYAKDSEIISNYEYDKLYDELVELESETGIVLPLSPTVKVGYEVIDFLQKVPHESRMLSLNKTKESHKLKSFLNGHSGVLSWKLDGLTIVLKYNGGKLVQAVTRGTGEVGEDVTHNAIHFKNVPKEIAFKGPVTFRGEAIISYCEFQRINDNLGEEEKYKNPRNLCSGTVRQLNSEILNKRNVLYYVFTIIGGPEEVFEDSKTLALDWAQNQGFSHVGYTICTEENIEDEIEVFKRNIETFDLPSDGLVLTFDCVSYSEALGATSKFPKDSLAFKWADEVKETTVLEVKWNTSRTGLINPIAVFEPVELEGTTVNRASLHNLSIVKSLKIGIGDTIRVYKANMIIPQVAENLTGSNNLEIPQFCNVCHGETEINALNGVEVLICTNPNCKAQLVKSLTHFVSRDAMNIEGLSESSLEKFVDKGFIGHYLDIYNLHSFKDEITTMEGFGEKSFTNLINAIEKSKTCALHSFIYALGINHIGLQTSKLMCRHFNDDEQLILKAEEAELDNIDGFGEVMAASVVKYFAHEENKEMVEKALKLLNIQKMSVINGTLSDVVFTITGTLSIYESRKALQNYIESKGGKVGSSVTGKTNYLVNNDTESNSAKNKKARELGVEIISEQEFFERF